MSRKAYLTKISKVISMFLCLVLLSLIAIPVFAPQVSAEDTQEGATGSRIIVSLGDSYSSGEGIEPFYDQDKRFDKFGSQDWLAHRSEKSWPGRLTLSGVDKTMADHRGDNWFFVATSGATTDELHNSMEKGYSWDVDHTGIEYIDPQLDVFNQLGDQKAEYVTLTLGGNDAHFTEVVTEAVMPHPINPGALNDKLNAIWNEFYYGADGKPSIRDRLRQAYYDIQEAAGPQAKIIVAGYPTLLSENGSKLFFSPEEAKLINDSVRRFNKEIESIVKECKADGMKICFVSVEEAFKDHEAYSDTPYINKVYMGTKSQDLKPEIASAYSMHPNDKGAEVYAKCVQDKIDQIEADGGKSEWPLMSSSDERDIALVLDVSGSMDGTPLEETLKASNKFINTVLKEDASIGVVTYDNTSMCLADFCMNESYLNNTIQNINSGGGTNMEAGLSKAYSMLQGSHAKKKIMVLMSDGEPNDGKTGEDLIAYADSIKNDGIYIYTLGFFSSVSDKTYPQSLMERIASDGCHYEVSSADDLVFFFSDIADQINGQKYIYIRIACPVDVTVTSGGETLCSVEENQNTRTQFGTLTFEENDEDSDDGTSRDNRIKVLRLKDGTDYDIRIEGNGRGRMNYTIGFMDENGEYSDLRKFNNIRITRDTVIDTVASNSDSTILNVDEDGNGRYDLKYKAGVNGRGEVVDYTYILYIVLTAVVLILILIVVLKIKKRRKKKNRA